MSLQSTSWIKAGGGIAAVGDDDDALIDLFVPADTIIGELIMYLLAL
jgi:hypothetical protein